MQDRSGTMWVGTHNGLNRLRNENGAWERFLHHTEDEQSLSDNLIMTLHQDRSGRLWVGTANGLNLARFGLDGIRFQRFTAPGPEENNFILTILDDDAGNLWLATSGGLARFEPESGVFFFSTRTTASRCRPSTTRPACVVATAGFFSAAAAASCISSRWIWRRRLPGTGGRHHRHHAGRSGHAGRGHCPAAVYEPASSRPGCSRSASNAPR